MPTFNPPPTALVLWFSLFYILALTCPMFHISFSLLFHTAYLPLSLYFFIWFTFFANPPPPPPPPPKKKKKKKKKMNKEIETIMLLFIWKLLPTWFFFQIFFTFSYIFYYHFMTYPSYIIHQGSLDHSPGHKYR